MPDAVWRLGFRIAYLLAKAWWRLIRREVRGVSVAVSHDGALLVVTPSYRPGLSLPGGYLKAGEDPRVAACRELVEEVGLRVLPEALADLGEITAEEGGGRARTRCYRLDLSARPAIRVDNREIVAARFLPLADLAPEAFIHPLRPLLRGLRRDTW